MKVQIYTLSHPITNEVRYVGRTIRKLSERLYYHVHNSKKNSHYTSNWIKGLVVKGLKPNIELLDIADENTWAIIEQYWIAQFKSWGFRLTNDCAGGRGNLQPSLQTRLKIAAATQKPVLQYSSSGEFIAEYKSLKEASEKNKIKFTHIIRSCKGTNICSRKYIWRYKISNDYQLKINTNNNLRNKRISQYTLDGKFIKTFNSLTEAENLTSTLHCSISECCNGKLKSSNDFMWKYYKEGDEKLNLQYFKKRTNKTVYQFDKDDNFITEYESVKNASEKTGVDKSNIANCCAGKYKTSGNYIWRYNKP